MPFDPRKLTCNSKTGVPILTARFVEDVATEVLQTYCPTVLKSPRQTPVAEIIEALKDRTKLKSSIEDLGHVDGRKVLGKVSFVRRTLFLDCCLLDARAVSFRFTAAHEIGHWILHRHNFKNFKLEPRINVQEMVDDDQSLCRLDQRTPRDWLEWQANVFAANLVMPRTTFSEALVKTQIELGIKRNIGVVVVSDATYSRKDLQIVLAHLAQIYGVSKESVHVRLKTLRLLREETSRGMKNVKDALSGLI